MAPDEIPPPGREEWGAWAESALRPTDNFDRPLASWGRRALAILIDAVVVALAGVALAAVVLGGVSRPRSGAFNMAIGLLYYGLLQRQPRGPDAGQDGSGDPGPRRPHGRAPGGGPGNGALPGVRRPSPRLRAPRCGRRVVAPVGRPPPGLARPRRG